ncbi:hypothetical protein GCM10027299_14900 [Larkinella ripae]
MTELPFQPQLIASSKQQTMKTFSILCLTLLVIVLEFRPKRFAALDFTSDQFDISWEEITADLWP